MDTNAWNKTLRRCDLLNYSAQQFIDSWRTRVISNQNGKFIVSKMYHCGSVFIINSKPFGIMSRVSHARIANVMNVGLHQPVIILKDE